MTPTTSSVIAPVLPVPGDNSEAAGEAVSPPPPASAEASSDVRLWCRPLSAVVGEPLRRFAYIDRRLRTRKLQPVV